jgi:hypothetical protein
MRIQDGLLQSLTATRQVRSKSRRQTGNWNQPTQIRGNAWKDYLPGRRLKETPSVPDDSAQQKRPHDGRGRLVREDSRYERAQ